MVDWALKINYLYIYPGKANCDKVGLSSLLLMNSYIYMYIYSFVGLLQNVAMVTLCSAAVGSFNVHTPVAHGISVSGLTRRTRH